MRTLVTGAASLVGSLVCDRLLAEGHEVVAIDDLSSGSFGNLKHLTEAERFVFHEHDVARPFDADVDAVLHLAVPSSRRRCARDPAAAAVTCAAGTKHVLEIAATRGVRVVLATSTERYGGGVECAEWLARSATAVDTRIVRAPAAFGPGLDPDPEHPVARVVLRALAYGADAPPSSRTIGDVEIVPADVVAATILRALELPSCAEPILASTRRMPAAKLAALLTDAIDAEDALDAEDDVAAALAETAQWFASRWRTLERASGVVVRGRSPAERSAAAPTPRRLAGAR